MKYLLISLLVISLALFFSCASKDDLPPLVSAESLNFDNQGGKDSVIINSSENWTIDGVYTVNSANEKGGVLWGLVYNLEKGKFVTNNLNVPLELHGLGKLVSGLLPDNGVTIERLDNNKIVVAFKQNFAYNDFNIAIDLKGDTWQKTIIVKQPTADKFTVESIVYQLGDDGAESIYWKDSPKREVEVTDAAAKVVLNPYDFASVYSQFKSDDVNSFYWVSAFDAPEVKIPHGISSKDGELYYVDKETFSYCSQVRSSINFMDINKGAKY